MTKTDKQKASNLILLVLIAASLTKQINPVWIKILNIPVYYFFQEKLIRPNLSVKWNRKLQHGGWICVPLVSSPESECGWVLWTRGSVPSSAPSLRGRSPHFLHSRPPLVTRPSALTGLPSAGSATCYWVRRRSPNQHRKKSTGSKGEVTSSWHRRDTQRKSKTR